MGMHIVIAGAGDMGYHLAEQLSYDNKDIILIDTERDLLDLSLIHISEPTRPY